MGVDGGLHNNAKALEALHYADDPRLLLENRVKLPNCHQLNHELAPSLSSHGLRSSVCEVS